MRTARIFRGARPTLLPSERLRRSTPAEDINGHRGFDVVTAVFGSTRRVRIARLDDRRELACFAVHDSDIYVMEFGTQQSTSHAVLAPRRHEDAGLRIAYTLRHRFF